MANSIEHILFMTDFSKNAEKALPFAAEIAVQTGSDLSVFHAIQETMDLVPSFEENRERQVNEANEKFDELIGNLRKNERYRDLNISTILQSGHPVTNVFSQAEDHNTGLIVMGTQGASASRNALLGSVTTAVIKNSDIPVLAVPYGSKMDHFEHIAFATDFKEADLAALQYTATLAELFDATIDVLHIAEERNLKSEIKYRGFRDLVKEQVPYRKINFHIEYDYDFFPAAADYLSDHPVSLMVMIKYKKTFWEKMAERNHAKEMAFYSKVPLLVLSGEQILEEGTRPAKAAAES